MGAGMVVAGRGRGPPPRGGWGAPGGPPTDPRRAGAGGWIKYGLPRFTNRRWSTPPPPARGPGPFPKTHSTGRTAHLTNWYTPMVLANNQNPATGVP